MSELTPNTPTYTDIEGFDSVRNTMFHIGQYVERVMAYEAACDASDKEANDPRAIALFEAMDQENDALRARIVALVGHGDTR